MYRRPPQNCNKVPRPNGMDTGLASCCSPAAGNPAANWMSAGTMAANPSITPAGLPGLETGP